MFRADQVGSLVALFADSRGQAGTTYGKLSARAYRDTDGCSPEGTAMLVTRDSMASGALSAMVRPLKPARRR
jgi:hypothetical protein